MFCCLGSPVPVFPQFHRGDKIRPRVSSKYAVEQTPVPPPPGRRGSGMHTRISGSETKAKFFVRFLNAGRKSRQVVSWPGCSREFDRIIT